jgi:hypothetical protein
MSESRKPRRISMLNPVNAGLLLVAATFSGRLLFLSGASFLGFYFFVLENEHCPTNKSMTTHWSVVHRSAPAYVPTFAPLHGSRGQGNSERARESFLPCHRLASRTKLAHWQRLLGLD